MTVRIEPLSVCLARVKDRPPFLVDGLIAATATLLVGNPIAGKSMLSVSLAHALTQSKDEWLGRSISGAKHRVVFGVTDPGADEETARRCAAIGCGDMVLIHEVRPLETADGYWKELRDGVREIGTSLFILDNLMGALPPGADVNSQKDVRGVLDGMTMMVDAGIAVLIVHHTAKAGPGGHGSGRSPMGSQYIAAWGRNILNLDVRPGGKGARTLSVHGNDVESQKIGLSFTVDDDGAGLFLTDVSATEPPAARERSAERRAKHADRARFIASSPAATMSSTSAAARWLFEEAQESMPCTSEAAWRRRIDLLVRTGLLVKDQGRLRLPATVPSAA